MWYKDGEPECLHFILTFVSITGSTNGEYGAATRSYTHFKNRTSHERNFGNKAPRNFYTPGFNKPY